MNKRNDTQTRLFFMPNTNYVGFSTTCVNHIDFEKCVCHDEYDVKYRLSQSNMVQLKQNKRIKKQTESMGV